MKQKKNLFTLFGAVVLALALVAIPFISALAQDTLPPPLDPQSWKLQRDMGWDDWNPNPLINWVYDDTVEAARVLKGVLVLVDFPDRPFMVTEDVGADILGNPVVGGVATDDLADFWRDYLMVPSKDNNYVTIDSYWRENTYGVQTIELEAVGPYTLSRFEFQYGSLGITTTQRFDSIFPRGTGMATEAYNLAKASGDIAFFENGEPAYDFIFFIHAGYDPSGLWQEVGEMLFMTRDVISKEFSGLARMEAIEEKISAPGFDLASEFPGFYLFTKPTSNAEIANTYNSYKEVFFAAEYAAALAADPTLTEAAFETDTFRPSFDIKFADDALYQAMVPDILKGHLLRAKYAANNTAGNDMMQWAATRYVPWTSWFASMNFWTTEGTVRDAEFNYTFNVSTQAESDGMATFAHEFGHIRTLLDNYNAPYTLPMTRSYTGPWELMSRGSFGGPGGNHQRYQIPATMGGAAPPNQILDARLVNQFSAQEDLVNVTVAELKAYGPVVAELVAHNIPTNNSVIDYGVDGYRGLKLTGFTDQTPRDNNTLDPTNNTGGNLMDSPDALRTKIDPQKWNWGTFKNSNPALIHDSYTIEVVDKTGYDSFCNDHGVMIAKHASARQNYQPSSFIIDAHPGALGIVDFIRPNGEQAQMTDGDMLQLAAALFHAGVHNDPDYSNTFTGNHLYGPLFAGDPLAEPIVTKAAGNVVNEWEDEFNQLHFYILDKIVNPAANGNYLSYQVAIRSTDANALAVGGELEVAVAAVEAERVGRVAVVYFDVTNTGEATDIIRIQVEGMGATLLNNLYAIGAGETVTVPVYVELTSDVLGKDKEISFTASSESNGAKTAFATVAAEDLVIPNFSVYLNPDKTEVPYGYSLYVDVMLTGDINYTRAEAEIVYDTDLLTYAGFSDLAGWVGEVTKAGNTVKVQSVPNMNLYTGAPCVTPQRLVRLKFTAVSEYALDSVDTDLVIKSVTVNPQLGVVGTTAVAGDDLTVTLYKEFVKGLSNNMELYPDWIVDGETQPIFTYGDAICEIVYVEVPCDTDRDGLRDRVSIYIMRPKAKEGFLFPVLLEHSSYHNGTVMWSAVSGSAFDDYPEMREPFRYKDNWPIHKDPNDPAYADTTHLTYEDIRYKGFESYNWPWVDEAFETGSWYTGTEYGNVPAATVSALDAGGNIIYRQAPGFNFGNDMFTTHPAFGGNMSAQVPTYYRYYLPRGYALVLGQLLGNRDADGVTSTLHTEEVLSAMAVINWLNGEAKGYTSRRGNIEVKADWANGNVAMAGRSYPADIAFATVVSGVKGLKAVMPQCNGLNWYDYYRYAGTVNYPGGYGGEDLNNHASINFSRWRADLPPGGSTSNYFPDPNGQWFPKSVQDVFFETQKHMMEKTDPLTGDYNTEWEMRNFGRLVGYINEDVGLLMTTAFMDWNSQPKLSLANWTVLSDKCPGTFREFISISSHTDQQGAVVYGKSIAEWWNSWMDHFLLGQDNGVVEALPDLTVINSMTGAVEGYWIKGNPNAQPGDVDYDPVFLERGGIVPGARNQTIYLVPGQDGKAGRLSYNKPVTTVDHFSDMNVLDMLQANYPGCPTLTDTQKTINRSSDGNYRVTTGSGVGSQAQFCEGRAVGVNRTFDFGITGTAPEDIQAINQQIFAAVDKPIEGRLMYLSEPLTKDLRMSGTGAVFLQAAPSKGVGNLSAAVVEIGRVRNMDSSRSDAWSMTPGTGNNLLAPAYSLAVGGGTDYTISVGTFRNPSEVGAFMNYKYVTVGYADVQNPDYTGKTWCEVPEQNYIPNFYFQTTKIVPGTYYPYTIELDPYDYIFHAGSQIGIMVFGTDPDYSLLYDDCCIPEFDIKIGEGSYAVLPLILDELSASTLIEVDSATVVAGETVEIAYSVKDFNFGFSSLDVDLPFDSNILTPLNVVPASALGGADFAFTITGDVVNITASAAGNIASDGELFTVTYQVKTTAPDGTYPLGVTVNSAKHSSFLDKTVDLTLDVAAGLLTIEKSEQPLSGITVNFPGITATEVRYYTNVCGWQTVGVFDSVCAFEIPAEHKATWGTTTVQLLKGGMWYTFSGLDVGEEPLELNVPLAKITLTGITAACNLGLAQEDWVYRSAAATVGEPIEYLVFDNAKKYIVHLNLPGAPTILIPDIDAGATVDLSGYF